MFIFDFIEIYNIVWICWYLKNILIFIEYVEFIQFIKFILWIYRINWYLYSLIYEFIDVDYNFEKYIKNIKIITFLSFLIMFLC